MNTRSSDKKVDASSSRKRKTTDSAGSKRRKQAIVVKRSGGKKKQMVVEKAAAKDSSKPTAFRCNLAVVVEEISKLRGEGLIKESHLGAMLRTPFGAMFKAMYEDKIILDHVGMIGQVGKKIISSYSEKDDAFLMGGEVVKFTPDDVALTFGLPKHGKKIVLHSGDTVSQSSFMQRRFGGESSLKVTILHTAVRAILNEDGSEDDFARCFILYMLATVFFANSNRAISLSYVPYLEDLNKVWEVEWASIIHDHLMKMVRKHYKDPFRTAGCVVQLLVSLCCIFYSFCNLLLSVLILVLKLF